MSPKKQRFWFVILSVICVSMAVLLMINALKTKVIYFYAPSDLVGRTIEEGDKIRIGGLVKEGSLKQWGQGSISFIITDNREEIVVNYKGLLPNLFREGQGVVAQGVLLGNGEFEAKTILAKHDENYMPPEVIDSLKEKGEWRDNTGRYKELKE